MANQGRGGGRGGGWGRGWGRGRAAVQYHNQENDAYQAADQGNYQQAANLLRQAGRGRLAEGQRVGGENAGHRYHREQVVNRQANVFQRQADEQREIRQGPVGADGARPAPRQVGNAWQGGGRGGLAAQLAPAQAPVLNNDNFPALDDGGGGQPANAGRGRGRGGRAPNAWGPPPNVGRGRGNG